MFKFPQRFRLWTMKFFVAQRSRPLQLVVCKRIEYAQFQRVAPVMATLTKHWSQHITWFRAVVCPVLRSCMWYKTQRLHEIRLNERGNEFHGRKTVPDVAGVFVIKETAVWLKRFSWETHTCFWRRVTAAAWLDRAVSVWCKKADRSTGPVQCKVPSASPDWSTGPPTWFGSALSTLNLYLSRCPYKKSRASSVGRLLLRCMNTREKEDLNRVLPQFLEQFAVALPSLLIDWIKVQNDQANKD